MKVAIVGSGFIGHKRSRHLGRHQLVITADAVPERAESLAKLHQHARAVKSWQHAVEAPDVDIVVVSTTHKFLAEITQGAIETGKHVLVDKPAARYPKELDPVIEAARKHKCKVKVGFNHRYHPAIQKAHGLIKEEAIGPLMYIRGRYGHGGRLGYEKEWRANLDLAGGGELLDQGMHLIDLSRWLLGDFTCVEGHIATYFWNMPVEDNAFMLLKTAHNQTAFLHVSWTEWKNTFSLEIFGRDGKLHIDGLGGSYGVEQLAYYKMSPEMGPPQTTIWQFPGEDLSWQAEFNDFVKDIDEDRTPEPGLEDAQAALKVVHTIYQRNNNK